MKVLHIIWDLGQGGAQTYLVNLLRAHSRECALESDVVVLTSLGLLSETAMKYAKHLYYVGMKRGLDVFAAARLLSKIKAVRPDAIHLHTNTILVLMACAISRVPIIYTEHGVGLLKDCKHNALVGWLIYKVFFRWVACFIAVSDAMRVKMIDMNPSIASYTRVIPNGVDIDILPLPQAGAVNASQPGKKQCACKVGVVGRLTGIKGLDLFLRVAAEINRKQKDVSFYVVGDGELRGELETLASNLGIADYVHFLGYRDDVMIIIKEFDLYLMTSHFESFGLTLIEAMGVGVPVVAAKAEGPFGEIIEHGVDGLVMDSRDPCLIADAIIPLLQDKESRLRMGTLARSKVAAKYTMVANAANIYNCYKSVVDAKPC